MSRILFIYAKLNPTLSYRQGIVYMCDTQNDSSSSLFLYLSTGMHELLAPIVYVLHYERSITDLDPDDSQISLYAQFHIDHQSQSSSPSSPSYIALPITSGRVWVVSGCVGWMLVLLSLIRVDEFLCN